MADEISPEQQEQLHQQRRMAEQVANNVGLNKVSTLPPDPQAATLTMPQAKGFLERTFHIPKGQPLEHEWILKVLFHEMRIKLADGAYQSAHSNVSKIFDYIINRDTTQKNRLNLINGLKVYRSEQGVNHDQCGKLLRGCLKSAYERGRLSQNHGKDCSDYIFDLLRATHPIKKVATTKPALLAHWFAGQAWLRDPEIGIGSEAFSLLESPKATIGSLRVLAEETILLSLRIKQSFIAFVRRHHINVEAIISGDALWGGSFHFQQKARSKAFENLSELVSVDFEVDPTLRLFVQLLAYSQLSTNGLSHFDLGGFAIKNPQQDGRRCKNEFIKELNYSVVVELIRYAHGKVDAMPVMDVEQLAFGWLMAIMTVQQSAIRQLRRSDFHFARNRGGSVTSFECTYYKTRASKEHPLKTINKGTRMFDAISQYVLLRFPDGAEDGEILVSSAKTDFVAPAVLRRWLIFLDDCLGDATRERYVAEGESSVMYDALVAMMRWGIAAPKASGGSIRSSPENRELPCYLFQNNAIKTTSVYAHSDDFDISKLINWRSHSNATELASYLTQNNVEWLDRCGRVTRLVMLDLASHIYSKNRNKAALNLDIDAIRQKVENRRALLTEMARVATGRLDGQVTDLSSSEVDNPLAKVSLPPFMLDSPSQVALNLHYIAEFEIKADEIARNNSNFFLQEALPRVEILEALFAERRFSSFEAGKKIYETHGHKFPPMFMAEIGVGQ